MGVVIKICGLTRECDIAEAAKAGADYIGIVVEVPSSVRAQSMLRAAQLSSASILPVVAVTVNMPRDRLIQLYEMVKPSALQLHGDEPAQTIADLKRSINCEVWKAFKMPTAEAPFEIALAEKLLCAAEQHISAGADVILLDSQPSCGAYGGIGIQSNWEYARYIVERLNARVVLAGGLNPNNVADAIKIVRPWGVDVSSGVERSKGIKDGRLIREFIKNARAAQPNRCDDPPTAQ